MVDVQWKIKEFKITYDNSKLVIPTCEVCGREDPKEKLYRRPGHKNALPWTINAWGDKAIIVRVCHSCWLAWMDEYYGYPRYPRMWEDFVARRRLEVLVGLANETELN